MRDYIAIARRYLSDRGVNTSSWPDPVVRIAGDVAVVTFPREQLVAVTRGGDYKVMLTINRHTGEVLQVLEGV